MAPMACQYICLEPDSVRSFRSLFNRETSHFVLNALKWSVASVYNFSISSHAKDKNCGYTLNHKIFKTANCVKTILQNIIIVMLQRCTDGSKACSPKGSKCDTNPNKFIVFEVKIRISTNRDHTLTAIHVKITGICCVPLALSLVFLFSL